MKYFIIGLWLLLLPLATAGNSKTTFIPRSISTDQVFELDQTNYYFHQNNETKTTLFSLKPFYQTSCHPQKNARFFLVHNKQCITIQENGTGDVGSLWLNLIAAPPANYQSNLTIKPRRQTAGFIFTFYSYLPCLTEKLWFGLNTALVHAHHALHMSSMASPYPGTVLGFANTIQALTNPAWSAGKFYSCPRNRTGLDDIQLKLGYDILQKNAVAGALYLIGTIPTGKKIQSHYIFEPIVGSRHGSLGAGFNAQADIHPCNEAALSWLVDANYRYVFSAQERRSFDLKNGDWSRYLQVVTPDEILNSLPGINYFTRTVPITPGSTLQLWTALHYATCQWHIEAGYNFWFRAKEKIHGLCCNKSLGVGIFDLNFSCKPPANSASTATISQGASGANAVVKDAQFTPVTFNDFALCSAENSHAITNKFYASIAHEWLTLRAGLHGSYEFSTSNNALNQAAFWLELTTTF